MTLLLDGADKSVHLPSFYVVKIPVELVDERIIEVIYFYDESTLHYLCSFEANYLLEFAYTIGLSDDEDEEISANLSEGSPIYMLCQDIDSIPVGSNRILLKSTWTDGDIDFEEWNTGDTGTRERIKGELRDEWLEYALGNRHF